MVYMYALDSNATFKAPKIYTFSSAFFSEIFVFLSKIR